MNSWIASTGKYHTGKSKALDMLNVMICKHFSYDKKCHTTYTTDYEPQQEEECEENYKKNCFIEYKKVAHNVTVEFCHTPLVKDCNLDGPVECKTEYEAMCATR